MLKYYVILDLEWNGAYSKKSKKYINEIIEVGAVKIDQNMQVADTFTMLIKPQIGKKISGRVTELTSISNEELSGSKNTFTHAMRLLKSFAKDSVILTWGITDISTLMENNRYYLKTVELDFLTQYMNLQSYCEQCLNRVDPGKQMGLSTAAELLNIEYGEENLHRALQDSILSYYCFKELYDEEKVQSFIQTVNSKFYDKVAFKNVMLTDIDNPMLDKAELYIACSKCGRSPKQTSPWTVRNKAFRADFHCENCNEELIGRVQYKLRFEGVKVKRSVYIKPKESKEDNTEDEKDKEEPSAIYN